MSLPVHVFTVASQETFSPREKKLLHQAQSLGFLTLEKIKCETLYFLQGNLTAEEKKQIQNLVHDPVTEVCEEGRRGSNQPVTEVVFHPGVKDTVAEQLLKSAAGIQVKNLQRIATGNRYIIHSKNTLDETALHRLATRLFANPVIQYYKLGAIDPHFPDFAAQTSKVEIIPIRALSDKQLQTLSQEKRSALDLAEMKAIQTYYQKENRDPTDAEFEMIAQTWSEHCSHKTFRADIVFSPPPVRGRDRVGVVNQDDVINGLLNTYLRAATEKINAPWVRSAFVDNAGIIEFDEEYDIAFKVETHNHPSAIEPFGGANTGVGGVIRDVLGVSANPIALTDIFCFGPQNLPLEKLPEGTLHPRLISSGVVHGVEDYGNKTGIPTVNGAIFYDEGYVANPLVYCGCVGLLPKNSHPRTPHEADRIIVLGGKTGRDGIRGATFSSMTMDESTSLVAGSSVQIGDPIEAKGLIEVITRARDEKLYHAITDCGAGGLSSAVGEMGSDSGAAADITLLPLKYPGLQPWEMWLSEAQERMVLAVPKKNIKRLQTLCDIYGVELTDIGEFIDSGEITVRYQDQTVLRLSNAFLHKGMPKQKLLAKISSHDPLPLQGRGLEWGCKTTISNLLLALLSHPNIASKEEVIRRYDHEIQGATRIKPLVGVKNDGPSDACVLKPIVTKGNRGVVLANGINPEIGKHDPYAMALSVIDEAIRNVVAVGGDPRRIAILDNFCWGNPQDPKVLGDLVACTKGCYDGAVFYQTPFISGKDSLYNEYKTPSGERHAIPGTLLISAMGFIEDIDKAVTMDFKKSGNIIYLLGETRNDLLGSHYALCGGMLPEDATVPALPEHAPLLYRALHQAMQKDLVKACHDLSEGGLAVALAEMCIAGRKGAEIALTSDPAVFLFSESNGRFLVEVTPEQAAAFEQCFNEGLSSRLHQIGHIVNQEKLTIRQDNEVLFFLSLSQLIEAFLQKT